MADGRGSRIHLCGQLRVEIEGVAREPEVRGRQGRLVLAHLVLHRRRPVRRDELVEVLTGDGRAPQGGGALAPVLSRLRRALAPAGIVGRETVRLELPEPAWVDVEAIADAVAAARAALGTDPGAALAAARQAAELSAHGLLPGLEADWLAGPRAQVADARAEALELAARARLALGGPMLAPAVADARAAVAAAPFRESARVVLVDALRAAGNVAEALRAFDEIRVLLRDELGVGPGPELRAAHARLLDAPQTPTAAPRPAPAPAPAGLVERAAEVAACEAALERAAAGTGGILLVEGPAGIGKTRLLDAVRGRASERQMTVLAARASVLEREFGFGVVRQLLGPLAAEPGALEGPAAPARAVLAEAAGAAVGSFATLDGLFHLTATRAARSPLVLCADDLQWSDPASLRFLVYLARRLAGRPVLVAATVRTGEPGTDELLLDELARDPAAVVLRPAPLTAAATATLVRERLGGDVAPAFAAACQEVTAGNPLLVGQLLAALAAEAVTPDAAEAELVRAVGPRAVSRTVLGRLARLGEGVVDVARAVAVLGDQAGTAAVAAFAGADEPAVARAVEALVRAEILRDAEPPDFVHPLVRDAVHDDLPAARRGLEHARAARIVAEHGASPETVAAQLLLAPPRGDAWAVARLREAADVALRRGAPDAALSLLRRAQQEPPPAEERAALALQLGACAAYVRGPAGVEPLRAAYGGLTDPDERARAAIRLSQLLLFVASPAEGVRLAETAATELPSGHEDDRLALLAIRVVGSAFGAGPLPEPETLDAVRRGPRGTGAGARALTAMTAFRLALACEPAAEASALAHEALDGDGLPAIEVTAPVALGCTVLTLGEPAEGVRANARYAEHARRQGEVLGSIGAALWGGFARLWTGELAGAVDLLEQAQEGERLWGTKLDAVMGYSAAFLATAWLFRGHPDRAWAALDAVDAGSGESDGARFWLAVRGLLLTSAGRPEEALAITDRLAGMRPARTHPLWAPWRGLRARALHALGRPAEALAVAREDVALARLTGAPWLIGRGLTLVAEIEGAEGIASAKAAVAQLEGTSARLELARAHLALGNGLAARDTDHPGVTAAWGRARELAAGCGADAMVQRIDAARGGFQPAA